MPRPVRLLLRSLRWVVGTVCGVVLVASLVIWPRSYFYEDRVWVVETSRGETSIYRSFYGLALVLFWIPESEADSRLWTSEPYTNEDWRHALRHGVIRRPHLTHRARGVLAPIWWAAILGAVCTPLLLAKNRPIPSPRWFRFSLLDLMCTAAVVSAAVPLARSAFATYAEGGAVIVIEASVLLLVSYGALRHARSSSGFGRWGGAAVAASCLTGVAGLGLFYWHCVQNFEPLA